MAECGKGMEAKSAKVQPSVRRAGAGGKLTIADMSGAIRRQSMRKEEAERMEIKGKE